MFIFHLVIVLFYFSVYCLSDMFIFYLVIFCFSVRIIEYKNKNNKIKSKQGAETVDPSGAHEFTPGFSGVLATRSLVLYVCFVDRCLSFWPFSFGHCVVCPSSMYGIFQLLLKQQQVDKRWRCKNGCLYCHKEKRGGWIRSQNVPLSLALTTYTIKLLVIRNCVQLSKFIIFSSESETRGYGNGT
jgi:hypothetical protein